MGLSHAMHWWQEWQMRVLVLGSLLVYMSLYFAYSVRRSPKLRNLRFLVWSAYVGGDALAIYALATLFNRQRQQSACGSGGGSSDLEVLWAPVLLIHLGGQTTMSAYSLEDNELWKRHAMTLVSQVAVALYVFCNWWSGERQLLNAAVLLFVVGIMKFSYKPWSLKRASFKNMLASSALLMDRRKQKEGMIGRLWRVYTAYLMDIKSQDDLEKMFYPKRSTSQESAAEGSGVHHTEKDEESDWRDVEVGQDEVTSLGEFVRSARWQHDKADKSEQINKRYVFTPVSFLYKMFVNVPRPYSDRLQELKFFLLFSHPDSYKLLQECIYSTFMILYTKRRVTLTLLGACLQLSLPFLTLASVVLFAKSHKGGYDVNDVWVTYTLFSLTALHEFFPFVPFFRTFRANWHEMVSQGSLMSFCACQEATARFIRPYLLREYVIKHWHVKQEPAAREISDRVRKHVKDGWNSYIYGPISYRRFNNLRGQWTLNKYMNKMDTTGHGSRRWSDLASSLMAPFDESVLMWHVATDLCYYKDKPMLTATAAAAGGGGGGGEDEGSCANKTTRQHNAYLSRKISKYMAYLLFICPEMLVPGARSGLFNIASDHIAAILEKSDSKGGVPVTKAQGIAQRVIEDILPPSKQGDKKFSHLLIHAKKIAEALGSLGADDRWQVIDGVWVEMLCFSAARCSGYLHARSLGHGGEFLNYVWLLWSAMGMETLADKIIMTEPPGDEERRKEQEEEEEATREKEPKESAARGSARPEIYVDHIITEEISS